MSRSSLGLQHELAAAAVHGHDSTAPVQQAGDSSIIISELLVQFDAVALVLLLTTLVAFFVPVFILFPPIPVERSDALRQTHSRIGLSPKRTNLRNQLSSVHSPQPGEKAKVQSLHIYPIKSCKGIELARSRILTTGLEHDRLFTFAQLKDPGPNDASSTGDTKQTKPLWEFLTLRQLPLLANICVDLWSPDPTKTSRQLGRVDESFLVLRFPWRDRGMRGLLQWVAAKMSRGLKAVPEKECMLPVSFPSHQEIKDRGYTFANVRIWGDVVCALNVESELPSELAQYLGVKRRLGLFRMDPSNQRDVSGYTQPQSILGYQPTVDFQDAYPLHLLSLTSLRNLNLLILQDDAMKGLDARRFRPNIIITGSEEYEEETWKLINLKHPSTKEECLFDVTCRTVRCKLPNVDPETGIRHKSEPDRALRKFREVDAGAPKKGCMGMQLCPMFPQATNPGEELVSHIEVGMCIDVLKRGSHLYIKQ